MHKRDIVRIRCMVTASSSIITQFHSTSFRLTESIVSRVSKYYNFSFQFFGDFLDLIVSIWGIHTHTAAFHDIFRYENRLQGFHYRYSCSLHIMSRLQSVSMKYNVTYFCFGGVSCGFDNKISIWGIHGSLSYHIISQRYESTQFVQFRFAREFTSCSKIGVIRSHTANWNQKRRLIGGL